MRLKQLLNTEKPFLADGGLETVMIFEKGLELPYFASFTLLDSEQGHRALEEYYERFIDLAAESGRGFLLDTTTWRASVPWGSQMGLGESDIVDINRRAAAFAMTMRDRHERRDLPIMVNGVVGPAADGYVASQTLAPDDAQSIHMPQIRALRETGVDLASAMTMTHSGEAIGITRAAREANLPVVISFTVETDGNLPSGQPLDQAIEEVDNTTAAYPLFYMINCAHPDHFAHVMSASTLTRRLGGLRTNASRLSHAELDAAEELDAGDPEELGTLHEPLLTQLPNIRVLGGCCGTDHRHVGCVARASDTTSAAYEELANA